MNEITLQFNTALASALDDLQTSAPDVTIFRLDVAALIDEVIADPGALGFANVTDPAAPGLEPGDSSYDPSQIVSDPNSYLFWDTLHPTTAAHAILAEHAWAVVVPEPSGLLLVAVAWFILGTRRLHRAVVKPRAVETSRRLAAPSLGFNAEDAEAQRLAHQVGSGLGSVNLYSSESP